MINVLDTIIDQTAERFGIIVPQEKVENEATAMRMELQYRMQYRRLTSGNPYVDHEALQQELNAIELEAYRQVKTQLVLERVVKEEDLSVTQQELEEEAQAIATRQNMSLDMVKDFLGESLEPIRKDLLLRKAEEWILTN